MTSNGRWNQTRLFREVTCNRDTCINWCINVGLLPEIKLCRQCRSPMQIYERTDSSSGFIFRCHKRNHDIKVTMSKSTWFGNIHLSMEKCLLLTYLIARGLSYVDIENELYDNDSEISTGHDTIANRFRLVREIYCNDLEINYLNRGKIGGSGSVIEVDEMKFGRRKYNVGRIVEGSWIVGMIEHDTNELRIEICPNNIRDAHNLLAIINKHVEKGTTIMTDCWKSYDGLTADGFNHLTVCHKYNYIDPNTYANTQKIESNWRPLRNRLSSRGVNKEHLADHLCEYLWMRHVKKHNLDPFAELIKAIARIYV